VEKRFGKIHRAVMSNEGSIIVRFCAFAALRYIKEAGIPQGGLDEASPTCELLSSRISAGKLESVHMILEVATLDVRPGLESDFETAFDEAARIIIGMPGYISHELQRCVEKSNRYLLLVNWQTLEDHTVGFRQSVQYQQWKSLLHHFYDPFPTVEHYRRLQVE
jgi:heme-degrading monooxygenase HmoA